MTAVGPWMLAWWLAGCLLLTFAWLVGGVQTRNLWTDRRLAWWWWHWFTGGELETARSVEHEGYLRWYLLRRAGVAGLRVGLGLTWLVLLYARVDASAPVELAAWTVLVTVASTLGLAWVAVRAALWLWWVRPLHYALLKRSGWPDDVRPGKWIRVPRQWENHKLGVRATMAPTFDTREKNRAAVEEVISAKAEFGDVDFVWALAGRYNTLIVKPERRLPALVPFADDDVRALLQEPVRASKPLLGLGRDGAQVARDVDSDAPHVLVSAPTNGGKSAVIRNLAAQLMWHGALVYVVDFKRHSHLWARGLNRTRWAYDLADIDALLVEVAREAERRNAACDHLRAGDPFPEFERLVLVCDELNATMRLLNQWWRNAKDRSDPNDAPGVTALREVLFMGRAVRIHVIGAAQQGTAQALGGGDARENFSIRVLAGGYSTNTWRMLVPHLEYVPPTEHPGWALVCYGRQADETQTVWITEEEAHRWNAEKWGTTDHPEPEETLPSVTIEPEGTDPGETFEDLVRSGRIETPGTSGTQDAVVLVTLREAVERGILKGSLSTLKKRKSRDPNFPPVVKKGEGAHGGDLYLAEALRRWNAQRRGVAPGDPLVYFLVVGGKPVYGDQVKIGWTRNLDQRLKAFAMHLDDVVHTVADDEHKTQEQAFHRRWAAQRIREDREYFWVKGELAEYLGIRQEDP